MTKEQQFLEVEGYVPYYLNVISNRLTRGASRLYLKKFGIGVIEWRVIGTLAPRNSLAAGEIADFLAIDKAAVSRALRTLEMKDLVRLSAADRRRRPVTLTAAGKALHDQILPLALERQRILLAPLSKTEKGALLDLLRKVHKRLAALSEYDSQ